MKRFTCVATVLGMLATLSLTFDLSNAADKKEPSKKDRVKELMIQTHKGDNSPLMKVDRELKAEQPAWEEVQKHTKALVEVKKVMLEVGGPEVDFGYRSGKEYVKSVGDLETAAQKKDKQAASVAFQSIKASCASCHRDRMP